MSDLLAPCCVVRVPRHACSPRDHARAGEAWRLVQEVAVAASSAAGWPPERYRAEGNAFVVREMSAVHLRELRQGEEMPGRTCIAEVRRDLLMRRESWLGEAVRTSVQWVHLGRSGGPERAPRALLDAFVPRPHPAVELPAFEGVVPRPLPEFVVEPWYTEMDPMGHVNHPRYVDWADEALCRWVAGRGGDPQAAVAVAESLLFRASARAGDRVRVSLVKVGAAAKTSVFDLRFFAGEGSTERLVCEGRLWRRIAGGGG